MKLSGLTLGLGLAVLASSQMSFAQDSEYCKNPLKVTCADTKAERIVREARVDALKKDISAEAKINAAPRIAAMKKRVASFRIITRAFQTMKINNQEVMASAKRRLNGVESIVTNQSNIDLIKGNVLSAINESRLDSATKEKFKATINSVIIGNFSDFIERTDLEDSILSQILASPCGNDGLVVNAFATTIKKQRYVLVCPGFMIGATQQANDRDRLDTILHAISHELAHHIDPSEVGTDIYAPFINCLSSNYINDFEKTKEDAKFCKKKAKTPAECANKVVVSHAGELVADAWAIKATAIYARSQGYSQPKLDQFFAGGMMLLCGSGDEGIHPTGDFRIETLLRGSPEISDTLGCDNSARTKPSCQIEGEIRI